jgi:hypothetical protein
VSRLSRVPSTRCGGIIDGVAIIGGVWILCRKVLLPLSDNGVVVGTANYRRLDPQIRLGRVQYVDLRKAFAGIYDRIYWKRKSLSHEAEVRAVIVRRFEVQAELGVAVPVDLQRLLISVLPSPFTPEWFTSLVASMLKRFGVDSTVVPSELLSKPFF